MNFNEFNCYGCETKNCDGCREYSKYTGELGERIYMTDKEIEQTCADCACYFDCFGYGENDKFDLDHAKQCYNILFSCCEEEEK